MINEQNQLFLAYLRNAFCENAPAVDPISEEQLPKMAAFAREQKLLPILLDAMAHAQAFPDCPLTETLKRQARSEIMAQTLAMLELESLLTGFCNAGIPALTVKGEVCATTYPKPALRISGDADILVPKTRFLEACDMMMQCGFEAESEILEDEFEVTFYKIGNPLRVELHNSLFPPDDAIYNSGVFQFSAECEAETYTADDGYGFQSFPPREHLLYLILHAYKHFIHSGFGIRQACDIALWARAYTSRIDWKLLRLECGEARCFKFAMAILKLCECELGMKGAIPADWSDIETDYMPLLEDMLEGGIYGGTAMSRRHSAGITLNSVRASHQEKKSTFWESVFPSVTALSRKYPVLRKHLILLPSVWVVRLAKYLGEVIAAKGNNNRASQAIQIGNDRKKLLEFYDII